MIYPFKVYNSVFLLSFFGCIYRARQSLPNFRIFHHLRWTQDLCCSPPLLGTNYPVGTSCFEPCGLVHSSYRWNNTLRGHLELGFFWTLFFLSVSKSRETIWCLHIRVRFISLTSTVSRYIHLPIHDMYELHFTYPLIRWWMLEAFLAVLNAIDRNIFVKIFVWTYVFRSFGYVHS